MRLASVAVPAVVLALVTVVPTSVRAQAADSVATVPDTLAILVVRDTLAAPAMPDPKALHVFRDILLVNGLVWSYDRFIREGEGEGFKVGLNSWEENLRNGFEWDDNTFATNQFAHPFHGSLYFNSARSEGYDYWRAVPFTFAGSWLWEYLGETHHPSINDWFSTSFGGIALGEATHRLARAVTDETATGGGRFAREAAGLLINPVRGARRLFEGDWSRVQQNPVDRYPKSSAVSYQLGLRTTSEEKLWTADTTRVYIEVAARYGDPFLGEYRKPFDHFEFDLQVNFADASTIGHASARGILYGAEVSKSDAAHHLIAVYQHYDYVNTNAYVFGGQSVGLSFLSRIGRTSDYGVRSTLDLNALLLGATNADYENISGRSYDYGPGLGFSFKGAFMFRGDPFLTLTNSEWWVHSFNGTEGDHFLSTTRIRVEVPIHHKLGAGIEYMLNRADHRYRDFPDVHESMPELRAALAMNL